jgi:hypothetical protein
MNDVQQLLEQMTRRISALESQVAKLMPAQTPAQWQQITSLANAGTYDLVSNYSGLFIINDIVSGAVGVFLQGGGTIMLVSQTSQNYFSTTSGTASKINVYLNASYHVIVQNNRGSAITCNVLLLRTRSNA